MKWIYHEREAHMIYLLTTNRQLVIHIYIIGQQITVRKTLF